MNKYILLFTYVLKYTVCLHQYKYITMSLLKQQPLGNYMWNTIVI